MIALKLCSRWSIAYGNQLSINIPHFLSRKIYYFPDTAIFSIGSDGTDGPTDAAGGYCDGCTKERLMSKGIEVYQVLQENNAYMALEEAGGLIKTGATGTNVNDVAVLLIKREDKSSSFWTGCYGFIGIGSKAV